MKILHRILLLIVAVILLTTTANILLTRHQGEVFNADSEQILSQTLAQSLRDALVQDVIDGNKLRVSDLLTSIKGHDNPIEFLYVTGENHEVFAHSFGRAFPAYLVHDQDKHLNQSGIQLINRFQTSQGLIKEYSEALIQGLDITLHIGINRSRISELMATNTREVLKTSIAIALLTLFAAFIISKRITSPLTRLTAQIRLFGSGESVNFGNLQKADPEIRQLSRAFQASTSDLKEAVTQLQEREENLAITLNSIGDAVITTDSNGVVTRMNPTAETLTGWSSDEARGQRVNKVFSIVDATTRETIPNPADRVLTSGETVYLSNHTTLIGRDGTERHIADSAAPIRDENQHILGMVLVFNDVSEQYRLREEIRKNSQQVISILDKVADAYIVLDRDWRVLYLNTETERMLETDRKKMKGKIFWDEFPELSSYFYKKLRHSITDNEIVKFEGYYPPTEQWLEANAYPDSDQLYLYFRDVTQRKQMDEELLNHQQLLERQVKERTLELETKAKELTQATRLKSEFLANMSHELRTPMNSIIGFTSRVIKKAADQLEDRQLNNLRTVERNAHHLLGLINGLLDLSKIEAGKMEAHPERFDLAMLANEVITITRPMLENKSVDLIADIPLHKFQLNTDNVKLKQVLINLVSNSIKFTEEGSINITAESLSDAPEPQISIRVTDTGVGMGQEALRYIFEAFRQVDGALTRKVGGTGLGLAIVKSFTELLRGKISVESGEGKGTSFELVLPVNLGDAETPVITSQPTQVPTAEYDSNKLTVLCIDDEIEAQDLIAACLSDEGYQVIKASSAEEGLALAKQFRPFAITLDILMPHKDGWSVLSELKADEQTRYIPVFIISFVENKSLGYQLGAFDFMSKPVNPEYLIESIKRLTQNSMTNILVVDDDAEARDLMSEILRDANIKFEVAIDGNNALSLLEKAGGEPPELILLDLMMPDMDGFEFLQEKQKNPAWVAIPVIVITAKSLEEHERDFLRPRVAGILAKEELTSEKILQQLSASIACLKDGNLTAEK